MKYISYTFIDEATQLPVSQEPARKGPIMPEGVVYVFSIEDSFSSGVPSFFGISEDSFKVSAWMAEYTLEEFLFTFKGELTKRASIKKRLLLSQGFIEYGDITVPYSCRVGLSEVINAMTLDPDLLSVDFEIISGWVKLDLAQAKEVLVLINKDVQKLFSWCYTIHRDIDESTSIEDLVDIQSIISEYQGCSNARLL